MRSVYSLAGIDSDDAHGWSPSGNPPAMNYAAPDHLLTAGICSATTRCGAHEGRTRTERAPSLQALGLVGAPITRVLERLIAQRGQPELPKTLLQSGLGAKPAHALFGTPERLGVHDARHGHSVTVEDWAALMDFFDLHLRGKKTERRLDHFPAEAELDAASDRARAVVRTSTGSPANRQRGPLGSGSLAALYRRGRFLFAA